MPLVCDRINAGGRLLLWQITESEEELAGLCSGYDIADSKGIASRPRRQQRLASRAALRVAFPDARVGYDEAGAPHIAESCLSISHCDGYAAVMLSDAPCGVDMEHTGRDFGRAAARFLSEREHSLPARGSAIFLPLIWCAKEALYKLSGHEGLDLKRDIEILSVDIDEGAITGRLPGIPCTGLAFMRYGDIVIVHTVKI